MKRKILNRNIRKFDKRLVEINYEVLKLKDIQEKMYDGKKQKELQKRMKKI